MSAEVEYGYGNSGEGEFCIEFKAALIQGQVSSC